MHNNDKWTMCSVSKSDCITPIRRLARFMMHECDKELVPTLSPNNGHCSDQQKKDFIVDFIDNHEIGMWGGWGFYSALPTLTDHYEVPVWVLL
jgi:hypothetical protein